MILTEEKPRYTEKNLFLYDFIHHKFHMGGLGLVPGPPR
jgi:hypothetical protein